MVVGGFSHFPTIDELYALRERFEETRADVAATADLFQTLKLPQFERETEYIALRREDGVYGFIDGYIVSTDGGRWPVSAYKSVTNEYLVPHSSAKHAQNQRDSYMVGALARFNVNHDLLHPVAQGVAAGLGLRPKATNPYLISVAQVVEIAHCVEEAIQLIDVLLQREIAWEEPVAPARQSGEGVGACEVPRGTLFHHYIIEDGIMVEANCIIPTGQNLANIELDMKALVPTILDRTQEQITHSLEMLVRAYDPCISCSTHLLDVKFE
jgi:coenzyme F420-reducing hydrogenase alpha subunit